MPFVNGWNLAAFMVTGGSLAALTRVVDRPADQLAAEIADIEAQPEGIGRVLDQAFDVMVNAFLPPKAAGQAAVVQYEITGPNGSDHRYVVRIAEDRCVWERGSADSPRATIGMSLIDFLKLVGGKLDSMQAVTTGKLMISGDQFFAESYQSWFERPA